MRRRGGERLRNAALAANTHVHTHTHAHTLFVLSSHGIVQDKDNSEHDWKQPGVYRGRKHLFSVFSEFIYELKPTGTFLSSNKFPGFPQCRLFMEILIHLIIISLLNY